MSFGSHNDFTKEMLGLSSLIAFIVFNDSIGVGNFTHRTC